MAFDAHKNFAVSQVVTPPSPQDTGTSLTVRAGEGARFPVAPFNATAFPLGQSADSPFAEIVRVTAISTDTFTITRNQESSGAKAIAAGWVIVAGITAKSLTDIESGMVVQMQSLTSNASATGSTLIPFDDTIPQNTEGDQYMSLAITPKSTLNNLIIQVVFFGSISVGNDLVVALFQDSTANALAAISGYNATATARMAIPLTHSMAAGTVSATTFKVRAGAPVANTTTFNGNSGTRDYGASVHSSIIIWEVTP